jgi:hypothetical protein
MRPACRRVVGGGPGGTMEVPALTHRFRVGWPGDRETLTIQVVLVDAEFPRAELQDRGSRPCVSLVGAQLDPLRTVPEDHCEQEPLDLRVDAVPHASGVKLGPTDLNAIRVLGGWRGPRSCRRRGQLADGKGDPVAVRQLRPDALVILALAGPLA